MTTDRPAFPLRVAMVSDWYLPRFGGIESQVDGLAQALTRAGVAVTALTPVPGPDTVNGIAVARLNPGDGASGGYWFPPSPVTSNMRDFLHVFEVMLRPGRTAPLRRLDAALASGRFDVMHAHLGASPFSYLAVNAAIARRLPVVATFHSLLSPQEIPVADLGFRLLGGRNWRDRAVLTAVSTRVVEVRRNMVGEAPILILPNGTDASFPTRPERRAGRDGTDGPVELVAALRFHPRKRPMALLSIMETLGRGGLPASACRLSIAGDGPLRPALEAEIARLGLEDRVRLIERLDGPGLARLFAGADLFLVPSHLELFGIAALQARMAGVPVLSMASTGTWDFLTEGVDGMSARDDAEFAAAIARFVADPDLRRRLAAGCATPPAGYDWQSLAARVIAFYDRAMRQVAAPGQSGEPSAPAWKRA